MTPAPGARGTREKGVRFAAIGVVNTLIDLVLFGVLATGGLPVVLANFISTSVGMAFSFFANRRHTWSSDQPVWQSAPRFLLVTAAGLWLLHPAVILGVAWLARTVDLGVALWLIWVPKLAAVAVGMVWNFVLYDRWVFVHRPAPPVGDYVPPGA